jgi:hypothetical protein
MSGSDCWITLSEFSCSAIFGAIVGFRAGRSLDAVANQVAELNRQIGDHRPKIIPDCIAVLDQLQGIGSFSREGRPVMWWLATWGNSLDIGGSLLRFGFRHLVIRSLCVRPPGLDFESRVAGGVSNQNAWARDRCGAAKHPGLTV